MPFAADRRDDGCKLRERMTVWIPSSALRPPGFCRRVVQGQWSIVHAGRDKIGAGGRACADRRSKEALQAGWRCVYAESRAI